MDMLIFGFYVLSVFVSYPCHRFVIIKGKYDVGNSDIFWVLLPIINVVPVIVAIGFWFDNLGGSSLAKWFFHLPKNWK